MENANTFRKLHIYFDSSEYIKKFNIFIHAHVKFQPVALEETKLLVKLDESDFELLFHFLQITPSEFDLLMVRGMDNAFNGGPRRFLSVVDLYVV